MTEPKPAENGNINAGIAENLQNRPTDGDYLISQRAAIDAVNDVLAEYIPTFRPWQEGIPLECALKIKALPPVQPKHGKWIDKSGGEYLELVCEAAPPINGYALTKSGFKSAEYKAAYEEWKTSLEEWAEA